MQNHRNTAKQLSCPSIALFIRLIQLFEQARLEPIRVRANDLFDSPRLDSRVTYFQNLLGSRMDWYIVEYYFYCNRFFLGAPAAFTGIDRRGGNSLVVWCQA